jgi:hypothetical protein
VLCGVVEFAGVELDVAALASAAPPPAAAPVTMSVVSKGVTRIVCTSFLGTRQTMLLKHLNPVGAR